MPLITLLILFLLIVQTIVLLVFSCQGIRQRAHCKMMPLKGFEQENLDSIDVVIAAKESVKVVARCVSSVLSSGFRNIIVCIDGNDISIMDKLRVMFPFVVFIQNKASIGKIKSQLRCLERSNSENVMVLDADIALIPSEINNFVSFYLSSGVDFLCPYSIGESNQMNSLLFGVAESDRYMRQRVVRAGRDAYNVSNLSGYCMLVKRTKYISVIDSEAIQDDVMATINLLQNGYKVKTYHTAVCSELERTSLDSYLLQKIRWTAGNIVLLHSYVALFRKADFSKALAFSASFLLWYWAFWIDFVAMVVGWFCPVIYVCLGIEYSFKYWALTRACSPDRRFYFNMVYVIFWPFFSIICLLLSPYYLKGKILEYKTRR